MSEALRGPKAPFCAWQLQGFRGMVIKRPTPRQPGGSSPEPPSGKLVSKELGNKQAHVSRRQNLDLSQSGSPLSAPMTVGTYDRCFFHC